MVKPRKHVRINIRGNSNKSTIKGTLSLHGSPEDIGDFFGVDGLFSDFNQVNDNESELKLVLSEAASRSNVTLSSHVTNEADADPMGASSFVIAVILIYGLSIVFIIASQVFIKKSKYHKDSEKQIIRYLEQAPELRSISEKESFKNLKTSLMPQIARSPSGRALMAKRLKYAPYLIHYIPLAAVNARPHGPTRTNRLQAIPEHTVEVHDPIPPLSVSGHVNALNPDQVGYVGVDNMTLSTYQQPHDSTSESGDLSRDPNVTGADDQKVVVFDGKSLDNLGIEGAAGDGGCIVHVGDVWVQPK